MIETKAQFDVGEEGLVTQDQIASKEQVLDFLKVSTCKLVFRRWRPAELDASKYAERLRKASPLCFIDYGERDPQVRNLTGVKAFAPFISPDGTRIVYNTSLRATEIFIRRLVPHAKPVQVGFGAYPSWWIDPRTSDEYIIYRTVCEPSRTAHPGETHRQRIDSITDRAMGKPVRLYHQGFGGGLSPDGCWLSTGFHLLTMVNLHSGKEYHPLGHDQTCNVTTPPDNSGRTMQLRASHDRFGVVRCDGSENVKYFKPEDTIEWQTPKWANHTDFAIAVAANYDKKYDIYLIRLSDHAMLRIVWGDSYVHPHLWCGL